MSEEKGMMSKLGDAVEAAKEKAQQVGASIAKKAGGGRPPTRSAR